MYIEPLCRVRLGKRGAGPDILGKLLAAELSSDAANLMFTAH
jgi:hypothetical protein